MVSTVSSSAVASSRVRSKPESGLPSASVSARGMEGPAGSYRRGPNVSRYGFVGVPGGLPGEAADERLDESLVARRQQALHEVDRIRVAADEHAARIAPHAAQDLSRRRLRRGDEQLIEARPARLDVGADQGGRALVDARRARDIRADASGMDAGRGDRRSREVELLTKRLREPADRELGGIVRRLRREADQAKGAGDIDDVSLAGCSRR